MITASLIVSVTAVSAILLAFVSLLYTIFQGTRSASVSGEGLLLKKIDDLKLEVKELKGELAATRAELERETNRNLLLMQRILKVENGGSHDA